ncbi:MAG: NACHT domain-containing protein [Gammaproteobacteria bacterium]|nr:NACHT domain-containing protein [Gammaproteobacteria bacterium]
MTSFNWLHLTDLHLGMDGQSHLWPNIREQFFVDLETLHRRCGPWDAVLFTGDFVQKGAAEEFTKLDGLLNELWDRLQTLGSEPVLLAVPGNHDLVRPDPKSSAVRLLEMWDNVPDIQEEFWKEPDSEHRTLISHAFANYLNWRDDSTLSGSLKMRPGLLPGDFSATWEDRGLRIGIVGLNTAFLQLTGAADYKGRLAWDARQFHAACGGDGAEWVKQHHACLLLTHQPPEWLNPACAKEVYAEINPAGRFTVHFFGHMHDNVIRGDSSGGGAVRRFWQGSSLFGLEQYEDKKDRHHGYAAGRIEVQKNTAYIRHWPRKAVYDAVNGWRFAPDHESCLLNKEGTRRERIKLLRPPDKPESSIHKPSAGSGRLQAEKQKRELAKYRKAMLRDCDIIRLIGLPEDDRHLAMKKLLLRQLYMPLRVRVEAPAGDKAADGFLERMEKTREQQHLQAAGRADGDAVSQEPEPAGKRLAAARRLVVLGDPGGGKTTLLRWIVTAYLLRLNRDPDLDKLPDINTLPAEDWLPVLVRCRALDSQKLRTCTLEDILRQTLRKAELPGSVAEISLLCALLEEGRAILLVDGLDEITDPVVRAAFCEQIECIAGAYPKAPVIVTSRVVGYREMHYRIGPEFEHATLAELSKEDKDAFVCRWCELTEPRDRRAAAEKELIQAIHSADRIERLTGNPMLLTTLALVKRKVGKLPNRRHELYREAVGVLLNWRSELELPMDRFEALPQLEYVAYEMCRRGVQRLRRDEILELLAGVRRDYPNIRPVHQRGPEDFLCLLEARTGLVVEAGETRHNGQMLPVYEFRHLSFQEYLAGLALVEGCFPEHDREFSLAQRVAPLAGQVVEKTDERGKPETEVTENWREALRLCVACCNNNVADKVLLAILQPMESEEQTGRARAILATLCLADEPNVSQAVGEQVLDSFARHIRDGDSTGLSIITNVKRAAMELAGSDWAHSLTASLVREFIKRDAATRTRVGALSGMVSETGLPAAADAVEAWMTQQVKRMSGNEAEAVEAALAVMEVAYNEKARMVPGLVDGLMSMLVRGNAVAHAASWTLFGLSGGWSGKEKGVWNPKLAELAHLVNYLDRPYIDPKILYWIGPIIQNFPLPEIVVPCISLLTHPYPQTRQVAVDALCAIKDPRAVEPLLQVLSDPEVDIRRAATDALGEIKDPHAVEPLIQVLSDPETDVRRAAANALGKIKDPRAVEPLIQILSGPEADVCWVAADALGEIKDPRAVEPLCRCLVDNDENIRKAALGGLAKLRDDETDAKLLTHNVDGFWLWLDPRMPISKAHLEKAAAKTGLSKKEIMRRFKALAKEFGLTLEGEEAKQPQKEGR